MLSIESILKFVHENLSNPRFKKLNEEHIVDEKTGIEFHMYDDWFKMTKGEDIIAIFMILHLLNKNMFGV